MQLYRLSPAEAALATALCEGHTVAAHAEHHQVQMATVRTQLSAVFAKTATRTQSELMRLLYSLRP